MKSEKRKAKELILKLIPYSNGMIQTPIGKVHNQTELKRNAKEITKLCCDEIISAIDWHEFEVPNKEIEFWENVKRETDLL